MLNTIISAIQNKEVITFNYDGHPHKVEPHAVGLSKAGHKVLRCFQVKGQQQHNDSWVVVPLSKIADLSKTEQNFTCVQSDYKSGDKGMTIIYAQI